MQSEGYSCACVVLRFWLFRRVEGEQLTVNGLITCAGNWSEYRSYPSNELVDRLWVNSQTLKSFHALRICKSWNLSL